MGVNYERAYHELRGRLQILGIDFEHKMYIENNWTKGYREALTDMHKVIDTVHESTNRVPYSAKRGTCDMTEGIIDHSELEQSVTTFKCFTYVEIKGKTYYPGCVKIGQEFM